MAPAKKAAKKSTAKKATAKKSTAKKATAKKATRKSTAKKATAKKSTARKTTRASSSQTTENVVVASKLRETVRGYDIRMSSDFPEALNAEVHELVAKAVRRAKDNKRGTVRPEDL